MRLLVLGGTQFVGRSMVTEALARGHEVTLFNRGTRPDVFPDVEALQGDRDGGLEVLRGRTWDAVLDVSGYVPRLVRASSELLKDAAAHHVYVSTISVYGEADEEGLDEDGPVETLDDPTSEDIAAHYGGLKALCEQVVRGTVGDERALVIRCGLVVGPGDHTGRYTYWPVRLSEGGRVLGPGGAAQPVQMVDARDLAAFVLKALESRTHGTYNVTGDRLTAEDLLRRSASGVGTDAPQLVFAGDEWLLAHGVEPWSDLPLWLPAGQGQGTLAVDTSRARALGFTSRPVEDTARDTLAWQRETGGPRAEKYADVGISREREAELLAEWDAEQAG